MKKLIATVGIAIGILSIGSSAYAIDYAAIIRYGECMKSYHRALNAINPSLLKMAGPDAGHKQCAARAKAGLR